MPSHHPGEELLIAYAAGSLEEPVALVVATHLSYCGRCRAEVRRLEDLGGALLAELEPSPLGDDLLSKTMALLDQQPQDSLESSVAKVEPEPESGLVLPQPLKGYIGGALDSLKWKGSSSIAEARLLDQNTSFTTRLLRVKPGKALFQHSHEGEEFTLVLAGGYSDETGHFLVGDMTSCDTDVDHRPVADDGEECICLVVNSAPIRLTGKITRFLNPIVKI